MEGGLDSKDGSRGDEAITGGDEGISSRYRGGLNRGSSLLSSSSSSSSSARARSR